jgi:exopolysaccharide biosynthesis polyprenyl glycosylphosphotransferase
MESSPTQVETLVDTQPAFGARPARPATTTKLQWLIFVGALLLSDLLMAGLGLRIAYLVRFELAVPIFQLEVNPSILFYQRVALLMAPALLVVYALSGLYQEENLLGGPKEYSLIFRGTTVGLVALMAAEFLAIPLVIARGWVILAWLLVAFFVSLGRFLLRRVIYQLRRRGHYLKPALIVGANGEGTSLAQQLISWETSGLRVVGFVDDASGVGSRVTKELVTLGTIDQLDEIVNRLGIEELILATSSLSRVQMLSMFERYGFSETVNLRMSSGLFEIITTGLNVKEFAYVPLVGVNKLRLTGTDWILKAALDYVLATTALILLAPVLIGLAIVIKLDSPGPIIFRRRVMGLNGQTFDAFKFRTMVVEGMEILKAHPELEKELLEKHKLKHDPRVTRLGRWLRRLSLDELPQLFNVLRREMSLVGPRMISPAEMSEYERWGYNLLTVQPGITGLWQVRGRSDVTYEERVRLDMYYIRNWTIWLDLQLLWQTVPTVLKGIGAY